MSGADFLVMALVVLVVAGFVFANIIMPIKLKKNQHNKDDM